MASSDVAQIESEKKIVDGYLAEHNLEENLNFIINQCVKEKPEDPYVFMAELMKERSTSSHGILAVFAREVLDCRGEPTVEAEVTTSLGSFRAVVGCGVSSSDFDEPLDLRDAALPRYRNKGVSTAVQRVNQSIAPLLIGKDPSEQDVIDTMLNDLDPSESKEELGANVMLAVSMAVCRAAARQKGVPLYRHIADLCGHTHLFLPVPAFAMLTGGVPAGKLNGLAWQEFSVLPVGAQSFAQALQMGCEVFANLRDILAEAALGITALDVAAAAAAGTGDAATEDGTASAAGKDGEGDGDAAAAAAAAAAASANTGVGDGVPMLLTAQGSLLPSLSDDREAVQLLVTAIARAGHTGACKIGITVNADAFFTDEGKYQLRYKQEGGAQGSKGAKSEQLIKQYRSLIETYPETIKSLQDPFGRDDLKAYRRFTEEMGETVQVLGHTAFCGKAPLLDAAIEQEALNAVQINPLHTCTVTATLRLARRAQEAGFGLSFARVDGDTDDTFLADLAVGAVAGQLKGGAPFGASSAAKYNRLLRIEEQLEAADGAAMFVGNRFMFPVAS